MRSNVKWPCSGQKYWIYLPSLASWRNNLWRNNLRRNNLRRKWWKILKGIYFIIWCNRVFLFNSLPGPILILRDNSNLDLTYSKMSIRNKKKHFPFIKRITNNRGVGWQANTRITPILPLFFSLFHCIIP